MFNKSYKEFKIKNSKILEVGTSYCEKHIESADGKQQCYIHTIIGPQKCRCRIKIVYIWY